jgi:3-hydroxyisobutyrate dehydrogenase-like beta-hydroxyacid dehydrogenase
MTVQTIGLVGVGAMGAGIGGSLVSAGSRVVSVLADRSTASRARAVAQGIEEVDDLGAVMARTRILLSIVPPGVASAVADGAARAATAIGAEGRIFVDCNAISPGRSRQIAGAVRAAGMSYVDGGLIGAPPSPGRPTALYLSGEGGDVVADALRTPEIRAEWLGPEPAAAASALKMSYAAWTKGLNALALSIRALARAEGVDEALVAEWQRSQPAALAAVDRAPATAAKAWRWVAEMREIARSLDEAGLPDGAFLSAAEVYRRLERYKDIDAPPTVDEMVDAVGSLPPITSGK